MMRVMVVEDEEMIRKGIVMAVDWAALDCIVVGEAANGEQALAVAEDCQPTLIITDLKMPKMDGLEMVRRLREAGSRAYVIILTAYDSFAYAQTAIRLGAVDFLLKPFHDGDLENAVLALQKRIAAQTAPQPEPLPGVKPGPKSRYVREAMVYLEQNCGSGDLSVGQAAAQLGLSEGHLSHLFKKETDMTLGAYLTRCRIQKAMALLREGKLKVYEVAEACGYRDIAYFSGKIPRCWRSQSTLAASVKFSRRASATAMPTGAEKPTRWSWATIFPAPSARSSPCLPRRRRFRCS